MPRDRDIEQAIAAGERNQDAKRLVQNFCAHAIVKKIGGTGIVEAQTGLPIGHHALECEHATDRGIGAWLIEEAALDFYERNCKGCAHRKALRKPDLLQLVDERERRIAARRSREEDSRRTQEAARKQRQLERQRLRAAALPATQGFLDDLEALDSANSADSRHKLRETIRLAPEVLTPEIQKHLFELIEADEGWATDVALDCLSLAGADREHTASAAMRSLTRGTSYRSAAEIVRTHSDSIAADMITRSAVYRLAMIAAPPPNPLHHFERAEKGDVRPLACLHQRFQRQVEREVDHLLMDDDPALVSAAARVLPVLYGGRPLPPALLRGAAAKLTRLDATLDAERDSTVRDVAHDLQNAIVSAFRADPEAVDRQLANYYEGASEDGEALLARVYSELFRSVRSRFGPPVDTTDLRPYRIALRRLLLLASTTKNYEVLMSLVDALRYPEEEIVRLGAEEIDQVLGTAILVDELVSKPEATAVQPAPDEVALAGITAQTRRNTRASVRDALVELAAHGAAAHRNARDKFIALLGKREILADTMYAALIEAAPRLMSTASTTNDVLPYLYGALVTSSNLVRSSAADALRELNARALENLPALVLDSFLLLLSDPYVIVHKAAVKSLASMRLPEEYKASVAQRLAVLVIAYSQDHSDDDFLVECVDQLTVLRHGEPDFSTGLGRVLVATLCTTKPRTVTRYRSWLLTRLAYVDEFPDLLTLLIRHCVDSGSNEDDLRRVIRAAPTKVFSRGREQLLTLLTGKAALQFGELLIEAFSAAHDWESAAAVSQKLLTQLPARVPNVSRLHYELVAAQAAYEDALAGQRLTEAARLRANWRALMSQLDREKDQGGDPTDTFERFLRATGRE